MAAVTAAASVGAWGAGTAAADSARPTLRYTCTLPPFSDEETMTVQLEWRAPDSVMAGRKTPIFPIDATATLGAAVTQRLSWISTETVEGWVDTAGVVKAPEGNRHVDVPLTVPRTNVPESGPMTVGAHGKTPGLVFHRPGHATITVSSGLTMHITPRNASGDAPAGELQLACQLDAGQNTVLSTFEITAVRGTSVPPAGGTEEPSASTTARGSTAPEPQGTVTSGPSVPTSSPTSSATVGSEDSTAAPTAGTADGPVAPVADSTSDSAAVNPLLVGLGILTVGTVVLGCVWWLKRRARRRA